MLLASSTLICPKAIPIYLYMCLYLQKNVLYSGSYLAGRHIHIGRILSSLDVIARGIVAFSFHKKLLKGIITG